MIILRGAFDPVTSAEIEQAKSLARSGHTQVGFLMNEEGILSFRERQELLKRALAPYRKLSVIPKEIPSVRVVDTDADEERVRSGEFRLAPKANRRFMIDHGYYFEHIVDVHCKPRRAVHSRSVAATARRIASWHNLDEQLAWRAGMLHDITKRWDDERGRKVLEIWEPEKLSMDPAVWHSYTAPVWLRQNMGLYDTKIRNAIRHHTIGDGKGDLDRILYISDKIEPTRAYDVSRQTALAKKDLKLCADTVLEESRAYILEKEGKYV